MQKKRFHSVLLALVCRMLFFLNKIDKMAIFGLHILKILHENNFWTKKRLFFVQFSQKKGLRLEKKANAF